MSEQYGASRNKDLEQRFIGVLADEDSPADIMTVSTSLLISLAVQTGMSKEKLLRVVEMAFDTISLAKNSRQAGTHGKDEAPPLPDGRCGCCGDTGISPQFVVVKQPESEKQCPFCDSKGRNPVETQRINDVINALRRGTTLEEIQYGIRAAQSLDDFGPMMNTAIWHAMRKLEIMAEKIKGEQVEGSSVDGGSK